MRQLKIHADCEDCRICLFSIFRSLNKEDRIRFSSFKSCLIYHPKQVIFADGGMPRGIYIIRSGKVKISKLSEEGKEQIVRFAKEGDIIGYRALLSEERYTCSAIALNETSLCFIPKPDFLDLVKGNGELAMRLIKLLARDLKQAERKILHLTHKNIRSRMAEVLLVLKETYGFEKDTLFLNINLTRAEIGSLAGITRESATRILHEFSDSGMIELHGNKISIIDQPALLKAANILD